MPFPDIAEPLLDWYGRCARSLPWRDEPTPYRVWVSEIMLQQTRVDTVIPYFERFMDALPDVAALAAAEEERLHKLWEGLGYYSRVRSLGAAARRIRSTYGGQLPRDPEQLRTLPGIGPYTAAAIASIAYGVPAAAVDGNVLRVAGRLTADRSEFRSADFRNRVTEGVQAAMPSDRAGDFTQALMELGAVVCLPNGPPKCDGCPLADRCAAHLRGEPTEYPGRSPRAAPPAEARTVFLIRSEQGVLIRRRPAKGLLAGLWEYPNDAGHFDADGASAFVAALGGVAAAPEALPPARHRFTHRLWDMRGWVVGTEPFDPPAGCRWASPDDLTDRLAVPTAFRAYTDELLRRFP